MQVLRGPGPGGRLPPPGKRTFGYGRSLLDKRTGEIHAEAPCSSEPWYAYGRFRVTDGQLQLAEIRLFPDPDRTGLKDRDPGWPPIGSSDAWLPADDLTASAVRTLPLRLLREIAIESVEKYGEGPLSEAERRSLSQRPGRAGRSDAFYAHWASRYVGKTGSRAPIAELARENGLRREQVRDLIQQARERGLLTPGRSSLLTKKAKTILKKEVDGQASK